MTTESDKPHIQPSEPESNKQTSDPGRTPGKAEGEDDDSASSGKTAKENDAESLQREN